MHSSYFESLIDAASKRLLALSWWERRAFKLRIITVRWHSHKLLSSIQKINHLYLCVYTYQLTRLNDFIRRQLSARRAACTFHHGEQVSASFSLFVNWKPDQDEQFKNWSKTNYSRVEYLLPCLFIIPTRRSRSDWLNEWMNKWRMLSFFSPLSSRRRSSLSFALSLSLSLLSVSLNKRGESVNSLMAFFRHWMMVNRRNDEGWWG